MSTALPPPATWSEIPSLEPPSGVQSNFENPETQGPVILIVGSILLVLMMLFYIVRMYTKLFVIQKFTWDDLTCSIAVILAAVYFALQIWIVKTGSVGKHQWDIPPATLLSNNFLVGDGSVIPILTGISLMFAKLSFFILYFELFRPLFWMRMSIYVGSALLVIFYVSISVTQAILTTPKSGETRVTHTLSKEEHYDQHELSIPFAAVGLAFDLFLWVLPLGAVWKLQLPYQRKAGVMLIFMTALLACVASLLSICYRVKLYRTSDITWAVLDVNIMSLVELYVGVIVSCMPSLSKMLQHHLPLYQSLRSKLYARWSLGRHTMWKSKDSSRKPGSGFGKPSAELYCDLEAYPIPHRPAMVESQFELGQMQSVKTYIDAGNKGTTLSRQCVDDDQIRLTREVWQR